MERDSLSRSAQHPRGAGRIALGQRFAYDKAMGPIETAIVEKLTSAFAPSRMEVENESHQHRGPHDAETHFRVLLVSTVFAGKSRVARSRAVHEALASELRSGVHALSVRCYDPAEWEARGGQDEMISPPCFGGSKRS